MIAEKLIRSFDARDEAAFEAAQAAS